MKSRLIYILTVVSFFIFPDINFGQAPNLRSTVSFALFTAAGALDNIGSSSVKGDIGSKTYTTTGFPPGTISGNIYNASHAQSTQAATDVFLLYDDLTRTPLDLIAVNLGGQTLTEGVHSTGSGVAANLNGNITLNGQGNPNALFIIRIDGALAVSGSSNVLLINSASPNNVYWQINGAFSLGTSSVFRGTIVSAGAISLLASSTLIGKGLTKAGAIDLNTSIVITKQNPEVPSVTLTQPSCTLATGGITITAPVAVGMTYSIDGLNYSNTSGIFSALSPGIYNVTDKDIDGFISGRTAATINAQPTSPAAPSVGAITQPTCLLATGSVELSGLPAGNWTMNPGAITGNTSSTTVSNLAAGTYNFTVTNAGGCISSASSNVVINTQPITPTAPIVGAITQPTCQLATASVILSGLPSGNWTINPGAITGNTSSTTVSNLAAGTYNFTVTNAGGCISSASSNVVINSQPITPTAPIVGAITQPTCLLATGIFVLSGLPSGNWTLNPGGNVGNTTSIQIDTLDVGTYQFTVTNAAGCTSVASANVVINAFPSTPAKPIVGIITQPTCTVATGGVVLSGLPSGNWTISPGAITGNISSTTILNLAAGTYQFTVTNAGGCISKASSNVVINTQPITPTAPIVGAITQPTCQLATGSVILSGLPSGNWTLNPGAITGNTSSTTVSNLAAGTYNFTVTNAGGCISSASSNVVINTQPITPTAPIVGAITQPTCLLATGIFVLSGLPSGNWTLNPGGNVGNTTSIQIDTLDVGTYQFTVTNAAGCTSAASANVVINAFPSTPVKPIVGIITQPTCTVATGSVILSGLPSGNWTINPGAITGNISSTTISNLAAGTYQFTVTNAGGCISKASLNVVINKQPVTPTAPILGAITQPTCLLATGIFVLSGLPSGNWTLNPGGNDGNTTSIQIDTLDVGTYQFTVTNGAGCTSAASANVVINAFPSTPAKPIVGIITQPTCTVATGSVVLSGLPSGNWTISPGAITGNTSSTTISNLVIGTYQFTVTNAGGCISKASAMITIKSPPIVQAAAGIITGITVVCKGQTGLIYSINAIIDATDYIWILPVGANITSGANTNRITVSYDTTAVSGNITVKATNNCGIELISGALAITVNNCYVADLSVKITANNMAPFIGRTIILSIDATNQGPYDATGVKVTTILQSGYTYQSTSSGNYDPFTNIWTIGNLKKGLSDNLTILVKVNATGNYVDTAIIYGNEPDDNMANNISIVKPIPTGFFIPEGFSPNGDRINDLFVIRGIQYYPDNHFTIFNRWGNKVYETLQYKNTWDGKSTMGLRIGGDDLPTGTYFYLLDLGDGSSIIKGTIYLNR